MKQITIIAILLLAIPGLKAQKKEIRKAQQEVRAGNLSSAASYLSQAKRIFAAADDRTRAEYYVVEAEMRLAEQQLDAKQIELISQSLNLADRYEITSALQERISQINLKIKGSSAAIAASEFKAKNYSRAAMLYKTAYQSSHDNRHLIKAARSHLLAEEHNDAFQAYSKLFQLGYTNVKSQYVATNVRSKKKEAFASKEARDEAVAEGSYKDPEIITTIGNLPEMLRGITVAAIPLGKNTEAVAIIDNVVAKTPKNTILLNLVSHLYKQLEAHEKYNAVVDQLIKDTPNDPNLYYNFAISSAENNDLERAEKFYKKTLKIDPAHINAKINLSVLLLEQDKVINDEMNTLGMSEADNKRYEKLKKKRIDLYAEVLPYIKSIVKAQPDNEDFAKKLTHINTFLGKDSNVAIAQEKLDD